MSRLLIVDDELLITTDIQEMVVSMGHEVVAVADTCEKAIALAESLRPDLVLMDIGLKGREDGIEAAAKINTRFYIPIVFLTAHADQQNLDRAKLARPYGYLLKPVLERELRATIEMALHTARVDVERREALAALKKSEQALREAQERTQLAQQAAGIGIFNWHLNDNTLFWSPQNDILFGFESGTLQIDLNRFMTFVHPDDYQKVTNQTREIIKNDTRFALEHRIIRNDGAVRWMAERGKVMRDADGRAVSMLGIMTDITERKREDERIRQLSVAIEQSPAPVLITDPQGNIEYVNPKFCELTGYSPEEVLGHNPRLLKSGRQSPAFYQELWRLITAGRTWKGELVNRKKDGTCYWESASISPISNDKGEITHFVAIKEDITARKMLETNLLAAKEATEAANRAKSEFLANMSHELRTPLNSIIGFSQILQNEAFGPLNPTQLEYLNNIRESGDHLLNMVNDILDLSKIEAGRLVLEKKPFNFKEMIDRALLIVQSLAMKRNLNLIVDIDPEAGWLVGDEVRLKQVVFNLLTNAVKFTDPGGKIGICTQPDGNRLVFTVWDEGIGIEEEYLDAIFQPFEQVRVSRNANEGGTGLGLSISRRIVELHQGDIKVRSQKGLGSRFTVTLPGRLAIRPQTDGRVQTEIKELSPADVRVLKVLVVEDNPGNMKLMQAALKPMRCQVTGASSGEEALSLVKEIPFDLIFMDIQLPGIDGTATMQAIRRDQNRGLPIIALTAFAMKGDRESFLHSGFDDYLSKPIDLKRLRQIVQNHSDRSASPKAS